MSSNASIRLLIVDDHPLFRQGVRWALAGEEDVTIVGEAASGEMAMEWLESAGSTYEPNVMLVDLNLPGMNGLELTRQVRRQYPAIGVVMLSMHESDEQAFNALRAGAAAYRSKDVKPQALMEILWRVARGEYVINDVVLEEPRVASRVLSQFRMLPEATPTNPDATDVPIFTPLSDREIEVLERIASGGSNKEIADSLKISTQTVKNHISSILRKLSLNDRTQAVLFALRRGWIETPSEIRQQSSEEQEE
ncbi:response regulator [Candidatus Viridilinea mediisalina]|uniref:DNA-binding response regulator n=1 Tax=Candidatus Viridilinea mediisalina TaxID=2024553 RepID=A0A2A6RIE6_9CHLR|nr:response regulator transcription factor [Candidatus Viridilinea mediisalina]PDW02713.1 DNA-binding response regulator [Candidatus Viridilinea mediisalina]